VCAYKAAPFERMGLLARIQVIAVGSFTEQYDVVVVGAGHAGCEVEPVCGRERGAEAASGSPQAKS